jgi:hypothetical protein
LSREISIFRNEINALLDFEGGVNVARDFTPSIDAAHIGVTARDGVVTMTGQCRRT